MLWNILFRKKGTWVELDSFRVVFDGIVELAKFPVCESSIGIEVSSGGIDFDGLTEISNLNRSKFTAS